MLGWLATRWVVRLVFRHAQWVGEVSLSRHMIALWTSSEGDKSGSQLMHAMQQAVLKSPSDMKLQQS